jgi:hypothetical protein
MTDTSPLYSNTIITLTPNLGSGVSLSSGTFSYVPVKLMIMDDSTYSQTNSSGGWQVVDRPKTVAATQWYDRAPWQLQFKAYVAPEITDQIPIFLNGATNNTINLNTNTYTPSGAPITIPTDEGGFGGYNPALLAKAKLYLNQLENWLDPAFGTLQPPALSISGPVQGTDRKWVIYSLEFDEAIRDYTTGGIVQQAINITLYEFNPPVLSEYDLYNVTSPAAYVTAAAAQSSGPSTGTVTPPAASSPTYANGKLLPTPSKQITVNGKKVAINLKLASVKKGDTLKKFALRNKMSTTAVLQINYFVSAAQGNHLDKYYTQLYVKA